MHGRVATGLQQLKNLVVGGVIENHAQKSTKKHNQPPKKRSKPNQMGGSTSTNRGIRAFVAVLVALADRKICTLFGGAVWPIIGRRCIAVGHGPADVPPPTARSSR
jgi:hypothetical protein